MSFPITPEMVKEAYEKTGLKPINCRWQQRNFSGDPISADGLSAVYAARYGLGILDSIPMTGPSSATVSRMSSALGLDEGDFTSFMSGFDNGDPLNPERRDPWIAGYRSAQLMGLIPADPT